MGGPGGFLQKLRGSDQIIDGGCPRAIRGNLEISERERESTKGVESIVCRIVRKKSKNQIIDIYGPKVTILFVPPFARFVVS